MKFAEYRRQERTLTGRGRGVSSLSLTVAIAVLFSALLSAPPAVADETDAAAQQRLAELVRSVAAQRNGILLQADPVLQSVASGVANDALRGWSDRASTRARMWSAGLREFEYAPITLVSSVAPPDSAIRPILSDPSVDWSRFNSAAVGLSREGDRLAIAILLTRRAASWVPGDAAGTEVVSLPAGYSAPRLYVTEPTGLVSTRIPREIAERRYEVSTSPGMLEGAWLFELVADGRSGIEVLALWPRRTAPDVIVQVERATSGGKHERGDVLVMDGTPQVDGGGRPPVRVAGTTGGTPIDSAGWVAGASSGPNRAPRPEDVRAAEDQLWELIQSSRRSRGIPRLIRDPAITRAARTHAGDIGRGERFGHVTSSGTAMHRLQTQGLTAVRASENVAVVGDVTAAHAAFMASPSHRAALLDPELSHAGVGVVVRRDSLGRWSVSVSEVFAILMDEADPAVWEQAAFEQLARRREGLGLRKLVRRSKLDALARDASSGLVASGRFAIEAEDRKEMAEVVRFHFHTARRVGVDLVVGTDITAVANLSHAIEGDLVEVGIGVVRAPRALGEHAVGSLVVTLLFVER